MHQQLLSGDEAGKRRGWQMGCQGFSEVWWKPLAPRPSVGTLHSLHKLLSIGVQNKDVWAQASATCLMGWVLQYNPKKVHNKGLLVFRNVLDLNFSWTPENIDTLHRNRKGEAPCFCSFLCRLNSPLPLLLAFPRQWQTREEYVQDKIQFLNWRNIISLGRNVKKKLAL